MGKSKSRLSSFIERYTIKAKVPVRVRGEPAQPREPQSRVERGGEQTFLLHVRRQVQPVGGLAGARLSALRVHAAHHYRIAFTAETGSHMLLGYIEYVFYLFHNRQMVHLYFQLHQ